MTPDAPRWKLVVGWTVIIAVFPFALCVALLVAVSAVLEEAICKLSWNLDQWMSH